MEELEVVTEDVSVVFVVVAASDDVDESDVVTGVVEVDVDSDVAVVLSDAEVVAVSDVRREVLDVSSVDEESVVTASVVDVETGVEVVSEVEDDSSVLVGSAVVDVATELVVDVESSDV